MHIIDLFNKIANKEEVPKRIKISGWCYDFEWVDYMNNYYDKHEDIDLTSALLMCEDELNREVIIISQNTNKIQPLDIRQEQNINNNWKWVLYGGEHKYNIATPYKIMADKINELIKEINKFKEK